MFSLGRRLSALSFASPRASRPLPLGGVLLLLMLGAGLCAPWLAPFDPARQLDLVQLKNAAPTLAHPLGTDAYARDVLSRALFGARTTLLVAGGATALAFLVAIAWVTLMRWCPVPLAAGLLVVVDALRALPRKLLVLAILLPIPQPTIGGLAVVLGVTSWMSLTPLLRSEVARAEAEPSVESARALGLSWARLFAMHVLPQLSGPLAASAALMLADLVAAEAALAFLGVGVSVPTPSWGGMLLDALPYLTSAWWVALVPMCLVAVTVGALSRITRRRVSFSGHQM